MKVQEKEEDDRGSKKFVSIKRIIRRKYNWASHGSDRSRNWGRYIIYFYFYSQDRGCICE